MQFNQDAGSDLQSEINITPLVDVVLVLLIIFMVVVPLLMQGYDANIARSSSGAAPAQSAKSQLVLSIGPAGCNMPQRLAEALGSQPAEQRVLFLAADDSLNYEGVLRIIDLAKSGVPDLNIEFIATN
jgi:biopolymer transport protein TolR